MVEIPQRANGHPVYEAVYGLADSGGWLIRVQTETGEVAIHAARLTDVERRGYEAVRMGGQAAGTFDVTFKHVIDLAQADGRVPAG